MRSADVVGVRESPHGLHAGGAQDVSFAGSELPQRRLRISREDIAGATRRAFDGVAVGLYREGDALLPILVRNAGADRDPGDLGLLPVRSSTADTSVPLAQVLRDGERGISVTEEYPIIWRWDRRRYSRARMSLHP